VARDANREAVHSALDQLHRITSSRRSFARLMASAGVELTRTSADVLAQVCRTEAMSMGALAASLHLDPGATARIVAGLEDAGLLQRVRSEQDARINLVHTTPAGRAVNDKVREVEADHLERALTVLTDDELATCATTLVQLVAELRELEAGALRRPRTPLSGRRTPV
jgi:DNA-binding MarR family transcriptional regulator